MKIIVNTGKGGVGKTTISAITALNISRKYKTLVMSSDFAHSLGDCFGIKLSDSPHLISDNLYALEINPIKESKKAWQNLHSYIKDIIGQNAMSDIQMDELLLLPGFDDIFALLRILEEYEKGEYEAIVVDCGPSGETISLLSLGEKLDNLANTLVPLVKKVNKLIGTFVEKKTQVKKPKDIVFDEFIALSKRLYSLQKILQDKSITSIRLITKPSSVVINETFRTYSLTNMYGFYTDAVFINMIYPESLIDSSYGELLNEQSKNINKLKKFFDKQKIFKINLQDSEINGITQLKKLSDDVCKDEDLSKTLADYLPYYVEDIKGTKIVIIDIPYAKNGQIEVTRINDDIQITYLNHKRRFSLPDSLSSRKITNYELTNKKLKIMMDY